MKYVFITPVCSSEASIKDALSYWDYEIQVEDTGDLLLVVEDEEFVQALVNIGKACYFLTAQENNKEPFMVSV